LLGARTPQHRFVVRADKLRQAVPYHAAEHVLRAETPEFERTPIGIDDAPRAIQRIEGIAHAFQYRARIVRQRRQCFGVAGQLAVQTSLLGSGRPD
jgi:hypothetical protein